MTNKYTNVRIVAREDCTWCGGQGTRKVTSRLLSSAPLGVDPCPRCDGQGHRDTDLLLAGEPFFLVRGKDTLGPAMVAVYDGLMATVGAEAMTDRMHASLVALRERMLSWQAGNPGVVKHGD